jgi:hypothetical protein
MKSVLFGSLFFIGGYIAVNGQNANLVTNGAFNGNPAFTAWQIQQVEGPTASQLQGGNPGGFIWLNQEGGTTDPSIQQEINGLVIGQQYTISGDYRAGRDAQINCHCEGTLVLAVDLDRQELGTFPMPAHPNQWKQFAVVFTATSTSHQIRLRAEINGTDGDIALDNIKVLPKMADWYLLKKAVEDGGRN